MALDKYLTNAEINIKWPPKKIDSQYIDYLIYRLFYIDVMQLIKIKATLSKEFHIQPSEVDNMSYWEYELWLQEIQNQVKETNEKQEQEMKKYDLDKSMKTYKNPPNPMKNMKMPNFGNVNIKMPKYY